jgi:F0F1-type ATP synthase membrane subunit c/vacuolar-type H+-ATPase subunit K
MSKRKPINVEYKTLVAIWFALLTSQLVFLVVVYIAKPHLLTFDTSRSFFNDEPLITFAFAASAIVFVILSFALRRQHMRRAVRDQDAGCVQTGLVLGCALSEIASLLGLLLALIFEHPYFYLWIALGAIGILLHFPRKGHLDAAMPAQN